METSTKECYCLIEVPFFGSDLFRQHAKQFSAYGFRTITPLLSTKRAAEVGRQTFRATSPTIAQANAAKAALRTWFNPEYVKIGDPVEEKFSSLEEELQWLEDGFDRTYNFSDDEGAWRAGRAVHQRIDAIRSHLGMIPYFEEHPLTFNQPSDGTES